MSAGPGARRPLIVGNWKMNKTVAEARELIGELLEERLPHDVEAVVAPPFTALAAVHALLRDSGLGLGAQNMHPADYGPFTGEISPLMLRELGVRYVILGHSERRLVFGETDASVARKVRSALYHELTPIVAVGESSLEHANGEAFQRCSEQLQAAFDGVPAAEVAECVAAYEPLWAIGTGVAENPADANALIEELRGCVEGLSRARFLYGGSMKPENAGMLMAQPHIDGGLVGGASLAAGSFAAIVAAAAPKAASR